jgi:hypothetical protein
MELNFEELDSTNNLNDVNNDINNGVNYINYWSNANPTTSESSNPKKPKVSYDDILSSLNMVVSNGVLQFAKPVKQEQQEQKQVKPHQKKQVTIKTENNQHHQLPQLPQNNYITNKYFKDYQQQQQSVAEPQVPLTKEEYRQMMIRDYINRQQAQRRISQIKSRKLLFDTQHINIAPNQMPRDMNKLFKPFTTR